MDDTISRDAAINTLRAMQTYKLFEGDDLLLIDQAEAQTKLMMLPSAEPKIKCIAKVTLSDEQVKEAIEKVKNAKCEILAAQPERRKGKWINYKDEHCCSVCDWVIIEECWDEENRYDYCPYCGADMRGDGDEVE